MPVCRCELEPTSADIGEAFYEQRKKVHLILRNTGQVAANFQFMPLPGAMFGDEADKKFRTAPRWATIEPEQASNKTESFKVHFYMRVCQYLQGQGLAPYVSDLACTDAKQFCQQPSCRNATKPVRRCLPWNLPQRAC